MSQPSVSKSLALIEQQMGFSLFERYQGKMQPTAEARALYKEALRVHQDRLRFERFVDQHPPVSRWSVAGLCHACAGAEYIAAGGGAFSAELPDCGVVADMCLNNEIETAVEEGRYDLGFLVKPGYEPEENPLAICRGEMVCVLPGQHPLAQQTEIHWQDIPTRDLVYITTDARLVAMIAEEVPAFRQRRWRR
ncbi:LysR family transcriptional regulator [Klebsiella variicola subsp. variicola]|nr:LysR family transcriptional regulator [Klebsiella variicola subsp. variicola]